MNLNLNLKETSNIAEHFCQYFSNISSHITNDSLKCPPYLYNIYLPPSHNSSMFFALITPNELHSVLMKLKSGTSLGLDRLYTNIFKFH